LAAYFTGDISARQAKVVSAGKAIEMTARESYRRSRYGFGTVAAGFSGS
jgi:hypothetical protein